LDTNVEGGIVLQGRDRHGLIAAGHQHEHLACLKVVAAGVIGFDPAQGQARLTYGPDL
jgi:hypothetical protein